MSKESRQRLSRERDLLKTETEEWQSREQVEKPWVPWVALSVGLISFMVYLRTLQPTVGGGDSGEFIAVLFKNGIAHPPGYPLYFLLAKTFTHLLPLGAFAWRVNLFSALCSSLTAAVLLLFVRKWSGSLLAGILSAGLFAFSPLVWSYSTTAEVFALNNLLTVSFLWLALDSLIVENTTERRLRSLKFSALFMGLAFSNHHTSIAFTAPLFLFQLLTFRTHLKSNQRLLWQLLGLPLLGLLPYLCLPVIWAYAPTGNHLNTVWGDFETPAGFLWHVLRKDYGTLGLFAGQNTESNYLVRLGYYLEHICSQSLWIGVLLACVGIKYSIKNNNKSGFGKLCFALFLIYVLFFHYLAQGSFTDTIFRVMLERFWMQPDLLFFSWCGIGASLLYRGWRVVEQKKSLPGRPGPILASGALLLVAIQIGIHFKAQDQSKNRIFETYGKKILDAVEPNSILLTAGDSPSNTAIYLQECENYRPDVTLLGQRKISTSWARKRMLSELPQIQVPIEPSLGAFLEANFAKAKQTPIYVTPDLPNDEGDLSKFDAIPNGLTQRIYKKEIEPPLAALLSASEQSIAQIESLEELQKANPVSWENWMWRHFVISLDQVGTRLLNAGFLEESKSYYDKYTQKFPALPPQVYGNKGLAYLRLYEKSHDPIQKKGAIQAFQDYLKKAEVSDPGLEKAKEILKSLN